MENPPLAQCNCIIRWLFGKSNNAMLFLPNFVIVKQVFLLPGFVRSAKIENPRKSTKMKNMLPPRQKSEHKQYPPDRKKNPAGQPRQGSFNQLCPRRSVGGVPLCSREWLPQRIGEKGGPRRLFQGHRYSEIREVRLGDDRAGRQIAGLVFFL